jgi:hypothetical protein
MHGSVKAGVGKMVRLVRLILRFYRRFCLLALAISLFIIKESTAHGVEAIAIAFWTKVITAAIIGAFIWYRYQSGFYYYKNLGIGKGALLIAVTSLDLLLFILMFVVVSCLHD